MKFKNMGENNPNYKHKYNRYYFKDIDTEIKAYILGFIAADGSLCSSTTYKVTISQHIKDAEILEKINYKICKTNLIVKDKENLNKLVFNSKQMVIDICKHLQINPGKKDRLVKFPNLKNNKLKWAFIRGVFDGDGFILNRKSIKVDYPKVGIASYSKFMKTEIVKLLKQSDIRFFMNDEAIIISGIHSLNFMKKLYTNSNIRLNRKYKLYKEWNDWQPKVKHSYKTRRYL